MMVGTSKFLYFNVNGLNNPAKKAEIKDYVAKTFFSMYCFAETRFTKKSKFNVKNYVGSTAPENELTTNRGLHSIYSCTQQITEFPVPKVGFEAQAFLCEVKNTSVLVVVVYISPSLSLQSSDLDKIFSLRENVLVIGDFNAQHVTWNCLENNSRGNMLFRYCYERDYTVIAPNEFTRYDFGGRNKPSVIDFAITNNSKLDVRADVVHDFSSDHLPIVITVGETLLRRNSPPGWNFKKANWKLFRHSVDSLLDIRDLQNVDEIEDSVKLLTQAVQEAADKSIPKSKGTRESPLLTPELCDLKTKRNRYRREWQRTGCQSSRLLYCKADREFKQKVLILKSEIWSSGINSPLDFNRNLWKTVKKLKGGDPGVKPLRYGGNVAFRDEEKAAILSETVLPSSPVTLSDGSSLEIKAVVDKYLSSTNALSCTPPVLKPIKTKEITKVIQKLKSAKAPGEDGVSNILVKNLPRKAVVVLKNIINAMFKFNYFSEAFKNAIVTCILKPGKDASLAASYRPISLLRSFAKIAEIFINRGLCLWLQQREVLPPEQHGFRSGFGTSSQLVRVTNIIDSNLAAKNSVALISLDLTKAFDCLWHDGLIFKLIQLNAPGDLILLLHSYLSNRTFQVRVNNSLSAKKLLTSGVPQGSVLGPTLFILYLYDIPKPERTELGMYADDTAILSISKNPFMAAKYVERASNLIVQYFHKWRLHNNASKTQGIVFTRKRSVIPPITLSGERIVWAQEIRYLGLTFDKRLNFCKNLEHALSRAIQAKNILSPLIRQRSKILPNIKLLLYKTCIRPILAYGAEAWKGKLSKTNFNKMQVFQNVVIKHALGRSKFSETAEAHNLANVRYIVDFLNKL